MNKQLTDYNIRNNFKDIGMFRTTLEKHATNTIPGKLSLNNGILYLTLFGNSSLNVNDKYKNSNDFIIYGQLMHGTNFKAITFNNMKKTKKCFPKSSLCYFINKYIIYDFKFYDETLLNNSKQFNVSIDQLKDWSLITPKNRQRQLSLNKIPPITYFQYNNIWYTLYLIPEEKQFTGQFSNGSKYNSHLSITSSSKLNIQIVKDISHELLHLMILLMYRKLSITHIIWNYNNIQNNYLSSTNITQLPNYFHNSEPLSLFMLHHNNFDCGIIFKNFMERSPKLDSLINSILLDIRAQNPSFSSLVNYANSIEFYFSNYTYSNGKRINNFTNKIKIFIAKIPYKMKKVVYLNNNKDELNFVNQIKDTRDYFVHGINKDNAVHNNLQLTILVRKLHTLIYYFILNKLGIDNNLIIYHIKKHINGNRENDYLM